ncbi:PadR family transcriptional regulator [Microbacterium sediminicola]|uniref:PadR family transcriptional regulator n=1 Tax=Microbacterium sediminicola TaxID=415210 RepID=A0ABP4UEY0_9MICO
MATDRALTPLALLVLALLNEDDMHPYEMIRLMRSRSDDRLVRVTTGTVYHTINRLVAAGLACEVGVDREGKRPERTTYSLTTAGREAMRAWVRVQFSAPTRAEHLRVALSVSHNLERDEMVSLLERRVDILTRERSTHEQGLATARAQRVPEQFLLEVDRECEQLATDLRWTQGLLRRLRDEGMPWGHATEKSDRYIAQREAARA